MARFYSHMLQTTPHTTAGTDKIEGPNPIGTENWCCLQDGPTTAGITPNGPTTILTTQLTLTLQRISDEVQTQRCSLQSIEAYMQQHFMEIQVLQNLQAAKILELQAKLENQKVSQILLILILGLSNSSLKMNCHQLLFRCAIGRPFVMLRICPTSPLLQPQLCPRSAAIQLQLAICLN